MAKYKAGDKVVVRKDLNNDDKYWMDDKSDYWYADTSMLNFADKIVTISKVNVTYYLVEETDSDAYWTDEMFEGLAEEATPREFKVGDRVRVLKECWGSLKVGDLGTVIVVDEYSIGVEFDKSCGGHDCGCGKNGHCWWIEPDTIELIKEKPKSESTYKVRCVGYNKSEKNFTIGKVYEVKNNTITNDNGFIFRDSGNVIEWLKPWYNFEVVEEEPTPTPVVNVNVTVNLYENACWYCRKGGLVDLYLAGVMCICPSCGRVCNNIIPTRF